MKRRKQIDPRFQNLANCPACKSFHRTVLFPIEHSTVHKCRNCGLKYLDPCLNPDAMIKAYESNETLSSLHSHHQGYYDYGDVDKPSPTRTEFITALEICEQLLETSTSRSIFDVGFGNGFFLALAKKRGWTVDGVDSSVQNKEKAKSRYGLDLASGSFHRYSVGTNKFDVVAFWDVIEHLPDPEIFLNKAKSLLKPGGILLVGVPNDRSLMAAIAGVLYRISFKTFSFPIRKLYFLEHVSYFHLDALRILIEKNGFLYRDHFYSSTDLRKFKLSFIDRCLSHVLLALGKRIGRQNRLISFYSIKP